MRGNRYVAAGILCPHYKWQESRRITCDGAPGSANLTVTFFEAESFKDYRRDFCKGDYRRCPYFEAVEKGRREHV